MRSAWHIYLKIKFFATLFAVQILMTSYSQCVEYSLTANGDTINCKDKKGLKQGKWVNRIEELRGEPGYEEEGVYQNNNKTGYWRIFTLQGDLIGIENYRYGQKIGRAHV